MGSAYLIAFLTDDAPAMRSLYEQMRALGMTTTGDGRTGICEKYGVDRDRRTDTDAKIALNLLSDADEATLYFWTPSDAELRVSTFNLDSADWTVAKTTIGFQTTVLDPCVQDEATVKTRVDEIFEAAVSIATVTEPAFAWSAITDENEQYERVKPSARPISDHVDDLSWLTVMSPEVIKQFGGREHVLNTPAHRIRELDTGHIVLLLEDHPYEPTERQSWKRHLLG